MPLYGNHLQESPTEDSHFCQGGIVLRVSVFDPLNRHVAGLEKNQFEVYENGVKQTIGCFVHQSIPICIGIIYDMTLGSQSEIESLRNTIKRLVKSGNPGDEFFLIPFNDKSAWIESFDTQSSTKEYSSSHGQITAPTRLDDAASIGIKYIQNKTNENIALVVVTDISDREIGLALHRKTPDMKAVFETYTIGRSFMALPKELLGSGIPPKHAFKITEPREVDYYIDLIYAELRNQYILGYSPRNKAHDGKWRKISVEVNAPRGLPKLKTQTIKGYYAPSK